MVDLTTKRLITPNYFKNVIDYSVRTGQATLEQAQANFNLPSYMLQAAIGALVAGVLTSLVVAAFVRTRNA